MNQLKYRFYHTTLFFLILFIFSNSYIFAQQKYKTIPTKFEDYTIVANLDSLEQAVYAQKNNPSVFLHELIKLEVNREFRSDKFGQDLETIKKLAEEQSSDLGSTIYEYLKSADLWKSNLGEGAKVYFKIADYFEKHNDTLGMILIYHRLVKLNLSPMNILTGNKDIAKKYFDKIVYFGQKDLKDRLKIQVFIVRSDYDDRFKDNYIIKDGLDLIREAERLVAKNPEFTHTLCHFYTAIGIVFYTKKQFKELLVYHLKAHDYVKYRSTYSKMVSFYNVGNAYWYNKQYVEAEKYTREAIKLYYERKEDRLEFLIGTHKCLSSVLFYLNRYDESREAWLKVDSLRVVSGEKMRSQNLLEVETKYETQKKELENKRLALEAKEQKQKAELWGLLTIFFILVSGVIIWIYQKTKEKNTELTRLNELIALRNQDLNLANQRMEHFTHALSHDALGYINHILNYTTLGQNLTNNDAQLISVFQRILRNASRLKGMSVNLINYNKNRRVTNLENFDLNSILNEAVEDLAFDLSNPDIELKIEDLPQVHANREFVKEVFRNLLGNATKFKKPNTPLSIHITAKPNEQSDFVELQVQDNGMGIAPEKISEVFKEFVKGNKAADGSGLGLFICRQIIENLGGKIWVRSQQGEGCTFFLTLKKATV